MIHIKRSCHLLSHFSIEHCNHSCLNRWVRVSSPSVHGAPSWWCQSPLLWSRQCMWLISSFFSLLRTIFVYHICVSFSGNVHLKLWFNLLLCFRCNIWICEFKSSAQLIVPFKLKILRKLPKWFWSITNNQSVNQSILVTSFNESVVYVGIGQRRALWFSIKRRWNRWGIHTCSQCWTSTAHPRQYSQGKFSLLCFKLRYSILVCHLKHLLPITAISLFSGYDRGIIGL